MTAPGAGATVPAADLYPNRDIRRLALHVAIWTFAWALSSTFSAAFLLRLGLAPAQIFLTFAAILAARFVTRPVAMAFVLTWGIRRALILGATLCALSCPALALVDGVGPGLLAFVALSALGQVFYCTCYHVCFTALGESARRGVLVGAFQVLGTAAAASGPALGGLLLATRGPWVAFGLAFLIACAAIVPLVWIAEPRVERPTPRNAYSAAKSGALLYFADGWLQVSFTTAWSIVLFQALHDSYEAFGGTLSLAVVGGAIGGLVLGRVIDAGHGRSVAAVNAVLLAAAVVLRTLTFGDAYLAIAVAVCTATMNGLYLPAWMTAAYNEATLAPCTLRFQFAAETGWDAGGVAAGVVAATFCAIGLPIETTILLALPIIVVQALLLGGSYAGWRRLPRRKHIAATAAAAMDGNLKSV